MGKKIVVNLEHAEHILEIIRSNTQKDIPKGNGVLEKELRDATTLILNVLLRLDQLEDKGLDLKELEETMDYLDDCRRIIKDLMEEKVWERFFKNRAKRLNVISPKGDVMIMLE